MGLKVQERHVELHYLLDYCSAKIVVDDLIVPNVIIMLERGGPNIRLRLRSLRELENIHRILFGIF